MIEQQREPGRASPVKSDDRPIVAIRYGGRHIGLYRVKQVGEAGMVLKHGGISFPVGTALDVEDIQHLLPDGVSPRAAATVIDNTPGGLSLAWRGAREAERP
jgi:hypothetical protein